MHPSDSPKIDLVLALAALTKIAARLSLPQVMELVPLQEQRSLFLVSIGAKTLESEYNSNITEFREFWFLFEQIQKQQNAEKNTNAVAV